MAKTLVSVSTQPQGSSIDARAITPHHAPTKAPCVFLDGAALYRLLTVVPAAEPCGEALHVRPAFASPSTIATAARI